MSLESPYPPPKFTGISLRGAHAPPPPNNKFIGFWTDAQLEHNNISENLKTISRRNKKQSNYFIKILKIFILL